MNWKSVCVVSLVLCFSAAAVAQELEPRVPFAKIPARVAPLPADARIEFERRVVVKFVDDARVRALESGALISLAGRDLATVRTTAAELDAHFAPLIQLPEASLAELEARARARSGRAQADLAGWMTVELPARDDDELEDAANTLQALDVVEAAYIETNGVPPPADIAPPTPNLVASQTYRGPNPGMDVTFAWSLGLRGNGIRLSDCEYGWVATHEDLVDIDLHLEPGQTLHPQTISFGWDEHGTAVLGETSAVDNAYGCSGMAPNASVYTYPERSVEQNYRRVTAVTNAIFNSAVGDIVLLEMQAIGAGGDYGPAELELAVWNVCKTGTDAGVVIVGAAGNGNQNLDSPTYASYMARGDSGAILVGAGSANASHNKLSFSTYGSRVDVQGWGESVFSLGYGSFAQYGGDKNQRYTQGFNGTSSASPFVAAACALLQEHANTTLGAPLSPQAMRTLLETTGVPQGTGGNIGPFVSLSNAIANFPTPTFTSFCFGDGSLLTACPCFAPNTVPIPSGAAGHGCANSFDLDGAILAASGTTSPDTLVLDVQVGPSYVAFGFLVKGSAEVASGVANGDGVRCVSGSLVRFGGHNAGTNGDAVGTWSYPNSVQTTAVSIATAQGAGQTASYQLIYRNSAASFCTPETTNWSNGMRVAWP